MKIVVKNRKLPNGMYSKYARLSFEDLFDKIYVLSSAWNLKYR